jgi:hypothetical protein
MYILNVIPDIKIGLLRTIGIISLFYTPLYQLILYEKGDNEFFGEMSIFFYGEYTLELLNSIKQDIDYFKYLFDNVRIMTFYDTFTEKQKEQFNLQEYDNLPEIVFSKTFFE